MGPPAKEFHAKAQRRKGAKAQRREEDKEKEEEEEYRDRGKPVWHHPWLPRPFPFRILRILLAFASPRLCVNPSSS
jgi:hypothetical protein